MPPWRVSANGGGGDDDDDDEDDNRYSRSCCTHCDDTSCCDQDCCSYLAVGSLGLDASDVEIVGVGGSAGFQGREALP